MLTETALWLASKLIWTAIRPETLLLLLLVVAYGALRRGRPRVARWSFGVATLAFLAIAVFPLGQLVMAPLETAFPPRPAVNAPAGIVVLGGSEDTDRAAVWHQPLVNEAGDRFLAGIALARRYPDAELVFTGGRGEVLGSGPSGATVAERIFKQAGISGSRLTLEGKSRNTAENARRTRALVDGAGQGPWLLVTSAFHMPRAVAAFCAARWRNIVPWPTDYRTGAFWQDMGWSLASNLETLNTGIKEWVGLLGYRVLGHTDRLTDRRCVVG
jgi:uncharacterized SAM-binding protein YcdF (DUF218 family)